MGRCAASYAGAGGQHRKVESCILGGSGDEVGGWVGDGRVWKGCGRHLWRETSEIYGYMHGWVVQRYQEALSLAQWSQARKRPIIFGGRLAAAPFPSVIPSKGVR